MLYIHMYYLIVAIFFLLVHISYAYAYECDHFRDIDNGKIYYDEYNQIGLRAGTTAKLICQNGDVTTALCTENGWEPKSLGSCSSGKENALVKKIQYDPHAGKSALVVKDSPEKCVPLTKIANGYVSYVPYDLPPYNAGTVATLGCMPAYGPVGPTIARCMQGSWTIIGDCQPIKEQKCPPITNVHNGHISYSPGENGPYDYGAVAELTCNSGFDPSGNGRVQCGPNGWGPFPGIGRCLEMGGSGQCSALFTQNGQITYLQANQNLPYSSGTSALLMCNLGFTMQGSSSSICQGNQWSPSIGQCISSNSGIGGIGGFNGGQCTTLPLVFNGNIAYNQGSSFGSYPSGTQATLQCNAGYTASGNQQAYCQNGQWSTTTMGQCIQGNSGIGFPSSGIGCGLMLTPLYGNVQYNMQQSWGTYPAGTTASLTCNFGYNVYGSATTQCSNGQWYPPIGNCMSTGGLGTIGNSQCTFGMVIPLGSSPTATITYSNGGSSLGPFPSGTVATMNCPGGSIVSSQSYCQNGQWNPPTFQSCSTSGFSGGSQCLIGISAIGGTPTYSQGSSFGPYPSGTQAYLTCTSGSPQGSTQSTCQNGQWNPPTLGPCSTTGIGGFGTGGAQCYIGLFPPLNGNIQYSNNQNFGPWNSGATASVTCNSGYSPSGVTQAQCINGQFQPSTLGTCIQGFTSFPGSGTTSTCYAFPVVLNGNINYNNFQVPYPIGTLATLTCNPGYNIIGSSQAQCTQSGWDMFTMGTCIQNDSSSTPRDIESTRKFCADELEPPENGYITYSTNGSGLLPEGTLARIICLPGYRASNSLSTLTCENGHFHSENMAKCVPIEETNQLDQNEWFRENHGRETTGGNAQNTEHGVWGAGGTPGIVVQHRHSTIDPENEPKNCDIEIPKPDHGIIQYSSTTIHPPFLEGTKANLICEFGTNPQGTTESTCREGRWQPEKFSNCTVPDYMINMINAAKDEENRKNFCNPIPKMDGGNVIYNQFPTLNGTYNNGAFATLLCDFGRVGSSSQMTTTCQRGSWSPQLAVCQIPRLTAVQPNPNFSPIVFPVPGSQGGVITSTGAVNRQNIGENENRSIGQIVRNGEKRCGQPKAKLPHGELKFDTYSINGEYPSRAGVKLVCPNNLPIIHGADISHCINGTWVPSLGECSTNAFSTPITYSHTNSESGSSETPENLVKAFSGPGTCQPIVIPPHGRLSYIQAAVRKDFEFGTTAILICELGYSIVGNAALSCTPKGWMPKEGFGNCLSNSDFFKT